MAGVAHITNDFVILGPALSRGNKVIEAIHALYYLPDNFKLIFTGSLPVDRSFYNEIKSLVERDELVHRVQFASKVTDSDAVILPNIGKTRAPNSVTGDSPEALASAILTVARAV